MMLEKIELWLHEQPLSVVCLLGPVYLGLVGSYMYVKQVVT